MIEFEGMKAQASWRHRDQLRGLVQDQLGQRIRDQLRAQRWLQLFGLFGGDLRGQLYEQIRKVAR